VYSAAPSGRNNREEFMLRLESVKHPLLLETASPGPHRSAADFCRYHEIQLQTDGRSLLRAGLSIDEYLGLLLEKRCYADARRVLAHALPKRRALWWGCLCAWDVYRPQPPEEVHKVLQSVVDFILHPTEENRRATAARAQEVGPNALAHCLAMGAFCSDGSLAPPGLPCVAPRPFLTGRLVGVTVYLAAVMHEPAKYKDHLREYLAMGIEIFRGNNLWTDGGVSEAGEPSAAANPIPPVGDDPAAVTFQVAYGVTGFMEKEFR
jgi:hypothetical protein